MEENEMFSVLQGAAWKKGQKQFFVTFKYVSASEWFQFRVIFRAFTRNLPVFHGWDICALHPFL